MDETASKKRRNLMLTSVAIIVATYLGLKVPSLALSGMPLTGDLATDPWKLWVVIAILVVYQYWRFQTDPEVANLRRECRHAFTGYYRQYASTDLSHAARRMLKGSPRFGYQITLGSSLPDSPAFDWKRSEVTVEFRDSAGGFLGLDAMRARSGEQRMNYLLFANGNDASWRSAMSVKYELPIWQPILVTGRAAMHTAYKSSHCQDLLVPNVLGIVAFAIATARLFLLA